MADKTYVPTLRITLQTAHRYATRYQPKLSESLTPEQYTCLVAVIDAIASCLALLGDEPINP